jgi:hypothetical protein
MRGKTAFMPLRLAWRRRWIADGSAGLTTNILGIARGRKAGENMQHIARRLNEIPFVAAPSREVASFAQMTFLENLEVQADGTLLVTSVLDGRIWAVSPEGVLRVLAQVDGRIASVASRPDGGWLVFGATMENVSCVFTVEPDGSWARWLDIPQCVFPNGVQRLFSGRYLLADSISGVIWVVDWPTGAVDIWLKDPLLAPTPTAPFPGVNGLKTFRDRLYLTNSSRGCILSVALQDGWPEGTVAILEEGMAADDFAFDVHGAMYLTTHPFDTVIRRDQDGALTRIAGPDQGVVGCTACRFDNRPGAEAGLYVITDGGLFNAAAGGIGPAKIVRVEASASGAPVDYV